MAEPAEEGPATSLQPSGDTLLGDPRYKLLQSLFPGRLLSFKAASGDESGLTDGAGQNALDLDTDVEP